MAASQMQSVDQPSPPCLVTNGRQHTRGQGRLKLRVCDNCRIKKIKCDMKTPLCTSCSTRHVMCKYSRHRKKPGPPKRVVDISPSVTRSTTLMEPCQDPDIAAPPFMPGSYFTYEDQYQDSSFLVDNSSWADDQLGAETGRVNVAMPSVDMPAPSLPHNLTTHDASGGRTFLELNPETERLLLELYIRHIQPTYPFLPSSTSPTSNYGLSSMSPRLRMSIYAVASLYISPHQQVWPFSPEDFVAKATHHPNATDLNMDELKASILLCL
ncbi:hypothetical protein BJ166DRAFT_201630 [Pestalotiopsis sp. NC0098]|nr:hypothetical protein BJ166DRAFT_201630 [Pestalotiopsis sp. NC0098]